MRTKFIKVRCQKCKNEQNIFDSAASHVTCLVCDTQLATPTDGKAKVEAQVLEVLE